MAESENPNGDKPFQFTDRRRIDPTTGVRRDTGAAGAGSPFPGAPGAGPAQPGDPAGASQPLNVQQDSPELLAAQQEAAERTADLQRVSAEYANYRKRVDRDREQVIAAAKASVLTELFGVLDDIDRAEQHGDLTGAFKAVTDKLGGVLDRLGLKRFGDEGDTFDPAVHEAVQFATSSEVSEPVVSSVLRHGYQINERLARPAVVVVTGPEHDDAAGAPDDRGADGEAAEVDEPQA